MVNSSQCRKHGFALEEETATYSSILAWKIPRGFLDGSAGKESACNAGDAGDVGLIPGLGRSPGGGHGNPLQYSCPENSMDRGAWWVQSMGGNKLGMTEHAHIYTSCHVSKMLSRKRASAYRIIKCTQTFMFMYCYSYFTDTKPLLHIYLHFVFFHCNRWALGFKWKSSTFYRKKR